MNLRPLLAFAILLPAACSSQPSGRYDGERPPATSGVPRAPLTPVEPAPQYLYAPGVTIVSPERAQEIVANFRETYVRLDSPRMVFAVNRELVTPGGGLQLSERRERVETARTEVNSTLSSPDQPAPGAAPQTQVNVAIGGAAGGNTSTIPPGQGTATTRTERVTADNTYKASSATSVTLADRQTVRDIERLFGRPLRAGGARLADQRVVAQLIADKPIDHFITAVDEGARKDREALAKIADVVIEVLISSRPITVTAISGDQQTHHVPDIQVTAIRLADGAILGQAGSSDVLGRDRDAGRIVRNFDVNAIAEATALALMEDMVVTAP